MKNEQEAVAWGSIWESGHTMFHIVNHTRGGMLSGLAAAGYGCIMKVGIS